MATKRLPQTPDFKEILEKIDLALVEEAIIGGEPLSDVDLEDARRLCMIGAQTWLPRDLVEWTISGIEERREVPAIYSDAICSIEANLKGYFDIRGTMNGVFPFRGEKDADLYRFKGKTFVCDWKTTKNALDTRWRDRLVDSWQWRLYHVLQPMSVMFYRGIRRNGETRELPLEISQQRRGALDITTHETILQLRGVISQIQGWIDICLSVFPRSMPGACMSFGRECPRYDDCVDFEMPQQALTALPNISYSLLSNIALCPERARRTIIDAIAQTHGDAEDSEESLFGQAVHRGLANIYKQAFEIEDAQEKENDDITSGNNGHDETTKQTIHLVVCDNRAKDGGDSKTAQGSTPGNAPACGK